MTKEPFSLLEVLASASLAACRRLALPPQRPAREARGIAVLWWN